MVSVSDIYSLELIAIATLYNLKIPPNNFMDIEFIELEHRESVMKLMEICGIEMKEAYDLYTAAGYNFEVS